MASFFTPCPPPARPSGSIATSAASLPDEAEAYAALLTTPDGAPVFAMILGYNGPIPEGEKVLAPARAFGKPLADLVQPMPYSARNTMLDQPNAVNGIERYWKSGFTEDVRRRPRRHPPGRSRELRLASHRRS